MAGLPSSSLWCYDSALSWLFGTPKAKRRFYDTQVARCLCNSAPNPFKRRVRCYCIESALILSNSTWHEIHSFLAWPENPLLLCVGEGQDCQDEMASRSVSQQGSPGLREWKRRGTRDVAIKDSTRCAFFFCKLHRKWCVCLCKCHVWKFGFHSVWCSHCEWTSLWRLQSLKFEDLHS